jgi:PIN domain nuclease of toxin-antitoxin system
VHYLSRRLRRTLDVHRILALIDSAASLHLEPITRAHLLSFGQLAEIPEMHDRLIGAAALMHDATLVSRESGLRGVTTIKTVW